MLDSTKTSHIRFMDDLTDTPIFLLTALQSEARPLIERFRLKSVLNGPFRFYARDNISLIISGMGKVNCAAATAALLHGSSANETSICLNIGIAGHASLDLGSVFVAHKITDRISGKTWHPPMSFNPGCASSQLETVAKPCTDYPDNTGLDMEASAFYPIAIRYMQAELTQVVKVTSDSPDHPIENLDKYRISRLVADALPDVCAVVNQLQSLAALQFDGTRIRKRGGLFYQQWHFSVSQQNAFNRLLQRYFAIFGNLPELEDYSHLSSAGEVLKTLEKQLREKGFQFS